jgi:hypothetical protein
MKQAVLACLLLASSAFPAAAQKAPAQKVFTDDIDRFWVAFDSVQRVTDRSRQVALMEALYVNRRSPGLAAFMEARDYSADLWVDRIRAYPKFWASIRPNTLAVKARAKEIEQSIQRLQQLYPELQEAKIYFTVGALRSGGTVADHMVLIGTEIACGTPKTDVSEFKDQWLATVFKHQSLDNVVQLNVHEYVHTQQRGEEATTLLGQALHEGACEFVAELVTRKPQHSAYVTYGQAHEAELKAKFKQEMFGTGTRNWLYNGAEAATVADLGYFMGYAIHRAYYQRAKNKRQAIKDIIELNCADDAAVERFVQQSGYYPEGWDKAALLTALHARSPVVTQLLPFANGATDVDATVKQLVLQFDRAMDVRGKSFEPGGRGKEFFPLKNPVGFSPDGRTFTLDVELQPNHEYEFVVTPRGFRSQDGYPLREAYTVRFKTR